MLGFYFCPRLRDFPDRRLASIEPPTVYGDLMQPIFGRRIRTDAVREHWNEVVHLVASLQAGVVAPSVMLKKLAAYRRQNKLDLALQEPGQFAQHVAQDIGATGVLPQPSEYEVRADAEPAEFGQFAAIEA
jgi:TnpA family transposase